jgi:hypothetical protein
MFVLQGLCHCYVKDEGKLADKFIIEPITANSLECMAKGERLGRGEAASMDDCIVHPAAWLPPQVRIPKHACPCCEQQSRFLTH